MSTTISRTAYPFDTAPTPPCPRWCAFRAGHPWHSLTSEGVEVRSHAGPDFGEYVETYAIEYANAPGVLRYGLALPVDSRTPDLTVVQARDLAGNLVAAADWLAAQLVADSAAKSTRRPPSR